MRVGAKQDTFLHGRRASALGEVLEGTFREGKEGDTQEGPINSRTLKMKRFDGKVNTLIVVAREMKKEISIQGGNQSFKWLAFTTKYWYSRCHGKKDHPDK
ncbi:hypothetical protein AAMO2058_001023800 [Amorphochlora amoebiformis]